MLIVHAADIHLDSPLVGLEAYEGCPREALRGATRRAFEAMVRVAIDEQASLVLIAGDLYDGSWKDYATGLFFVREMRRLREAGIPVVVLRGNHDAESEITRHLRMPDNVFELPTNTAGSKLFEKLGVAVHGRGFFTREVREDLTKSYPAALPGYFNIGLLHTALEGRRGHETYAPTTPAVLTDRGYDYWALGHIHRREVVSKAPYIVYPGNLQGRHVRETGEKGCTLITIEGGRVTSLEHRALDVVRWADIEVVPGEDAARADVIDELRDAFEKAAADGEGRLVASRLTVRGATRAHGEIASGVEAFINEARAAAIDAGGDDLWLGDVRIETRLPIDRAALAESQDPIALILRSASEASRDSARAAELLACLNDLREKLPEELLNDAAFAFLHDPNELRGVLEEAEELLLGRLLGAGAGDP
ncbi:MAG: DNA repair exonuclease [Myxococcales bacterium]|nr:DNA repair exonuclease [Myxococcales bacterium]